LGTDVDRQRGQDTGDSSTRFRECYSALALCFDRSMLVCPPCISARRAIRNFCMKIESIEISVFELTMYPATTQVVEFGSAYDSRWKQAFPSGGDVPVQVIKVVTDEDVEGICTVGDWRFTELNWQQIATLKELAIGEDPLDRDRLWSKLSAASRFLSPVWWGGFDNCLWDIAGKVEGKPVAELLGGARISATAYYNTAGNSVEKLIQDGEAGLEAGFSTLKDHLAFSFKDNIAAFERFRSAFGSEVGLMHDAALASYNYEEAVEVGRALESTGFIWFEEPIDDRLHEQNVQLCQLLDIPIAGAETLMHDPQIGELWLRTGAVDILRVHARHGTTAVRRLATAAAELGMNVEPNAYGPLFGLVHAHVACGIENIDWFETAPPPNGAAMGEDIGLLNPVRPVDGQVTYPSEPGWGAVWDSKRFESKRVAVL
jgi:L-alanine-DL-glutamate epimerase-like enolase superfamily enzyme